MGIYDESSGWQRYVKYLVVLLLILLDVYLLLPAPYEINISSDIPIARPGDKIILWVEIKNTASAPLTGSRVVIDSRSNFLHVKPTYLDVSNIPPGGKATLKTSISVDTNTTYGDHLLRVFFSYPGKTEVVYYKVKVG